MSHCFIARLCALAAAAASLICGKQLPVKSYTTADGLASNKIYKILGDSRGFMWFCTPEGISRFDGYTFTNYGINEGLPSSDVRDVIETRGGEYWVATVRGIARFRPDGAAINKFRVYSLGENQIANLVMTLFEDTSGTIWAGTWGGLYRFNPQTERFMVVEIGLHPDLWEGAIVKVIIEDRDNDLWVGTSRGLYRRRRDGRIDLTWVCRAGAWVSSLFEDRQRRLWVGTRGGGLYKLMRDPVSASSFGIRSYGARERMAAIRIPSIIQSLDGTIWVATDKGLSELGEGGNASEFRTYGETEGLGGSSILALAEDRRGDLWVAAEADGAMRISRNGFTTYGRQDGFGRLFQVSVFGSRAGESLALVRNGVQTKLVLALFERDQFHFLSPQFGPIRYFGWRSGQMALHDHAGEWWFATQDGLCRFPKVSFETLGVTRPKRIYGKGDGFTVSEVTSLFEDSRGDIWIATNGGGKTHLSRWFRSSDAIHHYLPADLPAPITGDIVFTEDRSGNVWLSGCLGALLRYRQGRFERVASRDLAIYYWSDTLYADRSGRLWAGDREYGLMRTDNPSADHPTFVHYGTAQGLSSNSIACITEDRWGRIYMCTGHGLDRIEPATGRVRHYGSSDGLPRGELINAFWDGQATLWFQTMHAIVRFVPEPDIRDSPEIVKVRGIRIRGVPFHISDLGITDLSGLILPADQNQIEIGFSGLGFHPDLHYQYMLEGADHTWSAATDQRSVNYASLSPGSYRFLVRAVDMRGVAGSAPAVVAFRILAPIWQRWWFLLSAVSILLLIMHALYRYHLTRQLQMEQVRLHIATDLHDDIGASLSQMALLTEVASQQVETGSQLSGSLAQIGTAARELVDAMSEIVWSINPRRDALRDLSARMRAFASDVFPARNIDFRFAAPAVEWDAKLALDTRRQIFLIFKESVNNVIRHSKCSKAEIDFLTEPGMLIIQVRDNGQGFDDGQAPQGHGLNSMRDRAQRLKGALKIASGETGTTVTLTLPMGRSLTGWRKRFLRK